MSHTGTLMLAGLTLEGFSDRGFIVLSVLRNGEVLSRVTRELFLGCFAVTLEVDGRRFVLEADGRLKSWRCLEDGKVVSQTKSQSSWIKVAGLTGARVAAGLAGGLAVGGVIYAGAILLWEPGRGWVGTLVSAAIYVAVLGAIEWWQLVRLKRHLATGAQTTISVSALPPKA